MFVFLTSIVIGLEWILFMPMVISLFIIVSLLIIKVKNKKRIDDLLTVNKHIE